LGGLSGKLLLLTVVFVMLSEVLIFVPSIANFRNTWLIDKLTISGVAASILVETDMVAPGVQAELLRTTGAVAIALDDGTRRRLIAMSGPPGMIAHGRHGRGRPVLLHRRELPDPAQWRRGQPACHRPVADGAWRARRHRHAGGAAARRDAGVFRAHPGAVRRDLGDHRDARLSVAALAVRAPDAKAHPLDGPFSGQPGRPQPCDLALEPQRRDRRRGSAGSPTCRRRWR
jgi:hypothetical protein